MMETITRCSYFEKPALMRDFHDHEWGEPVAEADIVFEYVVLYAFSAGIGIKLVLQKREQFREALFGFVPERLAQLSPDAVDELLLDPRIIRNRRKMEATVTNAQAWLRLRDELGGDRQIVAFFYDFVNRQPIDNQRADGDSPPLSTPESEAMSKVLKKRGFTLKGPATCYGLMQTAGLVNDHALTCYRHAVCAELAGTLSF
ncbi:DNA-3-methyladenine glycosylase I [Dyadobacter arcticus]|uniref:DNA-3-methyladenine glycosylase I n=1 Tax=Dyadobacter arcticus TaxID=1078754 RepID=A0ABX0UIX1_9BACT|nr:DNA-3-methyladenine glycosylase I [Dyadobacter arcticus]NIJ52953.1 DNA-3-methyladenine glycosylase I [Dyadobacter arcticus]